MKHVKITAPNIQNTTTATSIQKYSTVRETDLLQEGDASSREEGDGGREEACEEGTGGPASTEGAAPESEEGGWHRSHPRQP